MERSVRYSLWIMVSLLTLSLNRTVPVVAQSDAVTYSNPLAYVGMDGNIYVTDIQSSKSTALTSDGYFQMPYSVNLSEKTGTKTYRNIRWSPNGGAFISGVSDSQYSLYFFKSGQSPISLTGDIGAGNDRSFPIGAWSPDGTEVAYLHVCEGNYCVGITNVETGLSRTIGSFEFDSAIGFGEDPGTLRLLDDYDQGIDHFTAAAFQISWSIYGILHNVSNFSSKYIESLELLSSKGQIVWQAARIFRCILSPGGTRAIAFLETHLKDESLFDFIFLNVSTGKYEYAPFPKKSVLKAWMPDGRSILYYRTEPKITFQPDVEDNNAQRTVSLWESSVDGKNNSLLATVSGYSIGTISVAPDGKGAVFSLITNAPVKPHDLIGSGEARQPHIELYYVDFATGVVKRLAFGGQPAFGKGVFMALPATHQ